MLAARMRSSQGSDPGTREERQQKSQSKLGRIDLCSVVWSRMDKVLVVNTPARFGDRGRATTWYRGAVCDEDTRSWILMLGLEFLQVIGNSAGVQMLADSGAALAACSPQLGASVNVTQRQE